MAEREGFQSSQRQRLGSGVSTSGACRDRDIDTSPTALPITFDWSVFGVGGSQRLLALAGLKTQSACCLPPFWQRRSGQRC